MTMKTRLEAYIASNKELLPPDATTIATWDGKRAYEEAFKVLRLATSVVEQRKGLTMLHYSAQQGYSEALYHLSLHYKTGFLDHMEKDVPFARQLAEAAAEAGHPIAQMLISLAYIHRGYDLKPSPEHKTKGMALLQKYAETNGDAQRYLAHCGKKDT